MHELSAVLAIAHRDVVKLLRDRTRMISDFVFPLIFIGVLGSSLQAGFGGATQFNILTFVFTGVLAQTLWQSSAMGVISLIEDRENDFSQEIFVSPISRYSILVGKVLGSHWWHCRRDSPSWSSASSSASRCHSRPCSPWSRSS